MNRAESRRSNVRSKRDIIVIDDDDSATQQPPLKKRESELSPEVMQRKFSELEQKLAKAENNFQGACVMIRESKERVEFLENLIDTKPQVVGGAMKTDAELEKKVNDLTTQLEEERKGVAEERKIQMEREDGLKKKILELTSKLGQHDGLQQSPPIPLSQQTLSGLRTPEKSTVTQTLQKLVVAEEAEITEIKFRANFPEISKVTKNTLYSQPIEVNGMTWKMRAVHKDNGTNFYLEGEHKDAIEWRCPVFAEFGVISHKSKKIVEKNKMKEIYDVHDHSKHIIYIPDKTMFNEKKAYVKDDSLNVTVDIRAFPRSIHGTTETTIRATFNEISKLANDNVFSEPTDHAGITWKMFMFKNVKDSIVFNLNAQKKDAVEWSCSLIAEFRLISQKTGEIVHVESTKRIYDEEKKTQWLGGISKKKLFDDVNGYVKDDSIIVDVILKAFPIN